MKTVPLRFVAEVRTSSVDKHAHDGERPVTLCNYTDVYRGDRLRPTAELMRATATEEEVKRFRLDVGDTVLTKDSEDPSDIGISAYIEDTADDFVCGYHLALVRPRADVHPRYLNWSLRGRRTLDHFTVHAAGISRYGLSQQGLRSAPVWLPDTVGQRRIADFLDDRVTRIDRIIAARHEQVSLVRGQEASLFHNVLDEAGLEQPLDVERGWASTRLPRGWRATTLGRALRQLTNGYVGPTRDILADAGVRYIQSVHIKQGRIDFERRPFFVAEEWHAARPRINLRHGDVLIVQTGAIGQVAVVPENFGEASCHALLIARTDDELVLPEYLGEMLRSRFGFSAMLARATGALHPHLEAGVRTAPIVIPSLATQRDIVDRVSVARSELGSGVQSLTRSIDLLTEYTSSLVTAAVAGELDVTTAGSGIPA